MLSSLATVYYTTRQVKRQLLHAGPRRLGHAPPLLVGALPMYPTLAFSQLALPPLLHSSDGRVLDGGLNLAKPRAAYSAHAAR